MSLLKNSKHSEQVLWVMLTFSLLFIFCDILIQYLGRELNLANAYMFLGALFGSSSVLRGWNKKEDTKREVGN